MICPSCRAAIPLGSLSCPNCGSPIQATPDMAGPVANTIPPAPPAVQSSVWPGMASPSSPPSAPSMPLNPDVPAYYTPAPSGYIPSAPPAQPGTPYGYSAPPSQPIPQQYIQQYSQPLTGAMPAIPSIPLGVVAGTPQAALAPAAPTQPGIFGATPAPGAAVPSNWLQSLLVRNLPFGVAVNPYAAAFIGAIVAIIGGLALTTAAQSLWSAALQGALDVSNPTVSAITPYLTPDIVKLFMIEQHVPLTVSAVASDASVSGASLNASLALPLTGLLLFPAIALTIGGYFSAASDYTRAPRYSVLRGALISPFYATLLAILALTNSGSAQATIAGSSINVTIAPDPLSAFLYGLLWSALFGALGGWIQLAGRKSLSAALATMRRSSRPELVGAGAGAVTAFALGVLGFMALEFALWALALVNQQATITPNATLSLFTQSADGFSLALFVAVTIAPTLATLLLALTTGASFTLSQTSGGAQATPVSLSYTMIGAQANHPIWWYAVLLIPFLALLIGGRVSARAAGATRADRALLAGALMSLPFSVLLTAMASFGMFNAQVSSPDVSVGISATISVFPAFFIALLASAVIGALGGLSEALLPWLGQLPRWLLTPVRPLSFLLNPLLDLITGSPAGTKRSLPRLYFYDGVLLTALLALAGVALDFVNASPTPALPFKTLILVDTIAAALLVGLPLLYFAGAVITSYSAPLYGVDLPPATPPSPPATLAAPMLPPGMAYTYTPVYSQPLSGPVGYQAAPSAPVIPAIPVYSPILPVTQPSLPAFAPGAPLAPSQSAPLPPTRASVPSVPIAPNMASAPSVPIAPATAAPIEPASSVEAPNGPESPGGQEATPPESDLPESDSEGAS